MSMNKVRYICAQPAVYYYTWQVEIMINNFIEVGIDPSQIDVLLMGDDMPHNWAKLVERYPVNFYLYKDTRINKKYIPAIYFHLVAKHLEAHQEIEQQTVFFYDTDIIFTKPLDLSWALGDDTWYFSDTNSYINYDYVFSKGEEQFLKMCEIVGIDPAIVKSKNNDSGGAQYLVKNPTSKLFKKIEEDSCKVYDYLCNHEPKWNRSDTYAIQKWTAGMWAFLWNAFLVADVKVDSRLDFIQATNPIGKKDCSIFHNAGVSHAGEGMFFKGAYMHKLPYDENLKIDPTKSSIIYYEYMKEVGKISVLK